MNRNGTLYMNTHKNWGHVLKKRKKSHLWSSWSKMTGIWN